MPDQVERTILAVDIDPQAAQRATQGIARVRAEYDKLFARGQALDTAFKTQGAAANRLNAQLSRLTDEYRAGRISQAQYQSEQVRLSTALNRADSAFGATTQAIRVTDNAIK